MAAGEKVVWVSLFRLLPHDLDLDKWHKMHGWIDEWQ